VRLPILNTKNTLSESHNTFGFNLLKVIREKETNINIVISPSSIALALSMTYNGADNETKKAMAKALEIKGFDVEEVNRQNAALISDLQNPDPNVEISIANSIWGKQGEKFKLAFLDENDKYYGAKIEYLDFSNPRSADTINTWISDKTKGKISQMLQPPLPSDIIMCLINAVYFKGIWTDEFDKKFTTDRDFYFSNTLKRKIPMMSKYEEDFNYLENNLFQAVYLPYGKNKRLRMFVFLPKKNISNFVSNLNITNWNKWLSLFTEREGRLYLPKFKIEYDTSLKNPLTTLGMGIAFSTGADFTKIAPNMLISEVAHSTFIEVNEQGTEAAAATVVLMAPGGFSEDKSFNMEVNKPFFFAIEDSKTGEIIFTGIITEPK
jgi:serpin B